MTSHEYARLLLAIPDCPIVKSDDGYEVERCFPLMPPRLHSLVKCTGYKGSVYYINEIDSIKHKNIIICKGVIIERKVQ